MNKYFNRIKLGELTEIIAGGDKPKNFSENKTATNTVPVFANAEGNNGLQGYTDIPRIIEPAVTISARGSKVGFAAIRKQPFFPIVRLLTLIPIKDRLDVDYLFYNLKLNRQNGTGSGQPQITIPEISEKIISVPPLLIQQKIAKVLSALDIKIELNNKINVELEAMAKLIYDYWFVQFDFPISKEQAIAMGNPKLEGKPYKTSGGKMVWNEVLKREIPERWEDEKIDDLGSIIGGSTPSKAIQENFTDSGIAWITPKDLSLNVGNKFISKGELDVSERGLKEASLNILPKGSVLMSSRAPVGYLAITQNDCTTNQGFKSIICNKAYSAEYVYYVLKQYMSTIEANATGSTFKEISASVFRSISIAKPQLSTVKDFVKQINAVFEKQNNLENQNKQLASLRDWLLPLLMSGQVTVVDSESKVKKAIAEKEQTAKPKNDSYAKIQMLYTTIWANKEIDVKQGEMATAKDVYLLDRIYGVETGFQFKQHNWGSFDPEEKKLLNTKQYFHKVNFPNSKAVYVDLKDEGKLLDKIPTHLKETVSNAISEMNATIFSRYFGTQKAEKKELFATVLKCIEDRQSLEIAVIRDEMSNWKIKQGGKESSKADKFTEAETREALEMIIKENWHRNVMR